MKKRILAMLGISANLLGVLLVGCAKSENDTLTEKIGAAWIRRHEVKMKLRKDSKNPFRYDSRSHKQMKALSFFDDLRIFTEKSDLI